MKHFFIALVFSAISTAVLAQGSVDPAAGKALWEGRDTNCRNCHGRDGEGGFGPALAGRSLSTQDFHQAVRTPWGIMPSFNQAQMSDAELANVAAYFAVLPRATTIAPWRVPVPATASRGQKVAIEMGCAQCHGVTFDIARGMLGGTATTFDEFKGLVYEHNANMSKMGVAEGNTPGDRLHMGDYSPYRVSDQQLKEIFDWTKNELGWRPFIETRLTTDKNDAASSVLKIENSGFKRKKGPAADDVTVRIVLPAGAKVVKASAQGYKGVKTEAAGDVAEWQFASLSPEEEREFTLTLSAPVKPGSLKGTMSWARPAPKTGAKLDVTNFTLRGPG